MKFILPVLVLFLLLGCSDQAQKDAKEVTQKVKNVDVEKVVEKSVEKTTQVADTVSEAVKKTDVKQVIEDTRKKVEEIAKVAGAKTEEITKSITTEVNKALDSVQKTPEATIDIASVAKIPAIAAVAPATDDGAKLYASKCASCHGSKAEKKALGQSEIIAGWSSDKVKAAIDGYKNGTYGKNMKALMQGQVSAFNDAEVLALADFISKQ